MKGQPLVTMRIRTLDRKIAGEHKITEADEVAVRSARLAI